MRYESVPSVNELLVPAAARQVAHVIIPVFSSNRNQVCNFSHSGWKLRTRCFAFGFAAVFESCNAYEFIPLRTSEHSQRSQSQA